MDNIKKLSLSGLSFMILTDNYDDRSKNLAYNEIKRRFYNNGCTYEAFMEYEVNAINLRGDNINNYLIGYNPNSQLFMELYFKYVKDCPYSVHGNLLFSEILLCNEDNQYGIIKKILNKELCNIKNRLCKTTYSSTESEILEIVYEKIKERLKFDKFSLLEDSYVNSVMDIVGNESSLIGEKAIKKLDAFGQKDFENCSKLELILGSLSLMQYDNEFLDNINMRLIAHRDLHKLGHQQRILKRSFNHDEVDYSFIKGIKRS